MSISSTSSESTGLLTSPSTSPRELKQETEIELERKRKADGLAWQLMLPTQKIVQIDKVIGYIADGKSATENQAKSDVCDACCGQEDRDCGRECCIARYIFFGCFCASLTLIILGVVLDSFVLQMVGGLTIAAPVLFCVLDGVSGSRCAPCTEPCLCGGFDRCCIRLPQNWLSKTATVSDVLKHITPAQKKEIDQLMTDLSKQEVENRCCGKTHFSNLSAAELIELLERIGLNTIEQAKTNDSSNLVNITVKNSRVLYMALQKIIHPSSIAPVEEKMTIY